MKLQLIIAIQVENGIAELIAGLVQLRRPDIRSIDGIRRLGGGQQDRHAAGKKQR